MTRYFRGWGTQITSLACSERKRLIAGSKGPKTQQPAKGSRPSILGIPVIEIAEGGDLSNSVLHVRRGWGPASRF